MRQSPPGLGILKASLDGSDHVEMVEDILERAVVGEPVQQISYGIFRLQAASIGSVVLVLLPAHRAQDHCRHIRPGA